MPAFSRFFSSSIFFLIGTGALLVLLVVLLTGGFVLDAGLIHISARRWPGPLILWVVAWAIAALRGRNAFTGSAAFFSDAIDRHAFSAAIVAACAAGAVGVGLGTYAASGSDAAGYVSESTLLASGRLVTAEPLAMSVPWPDATSAFSPLGYRPGVAPGELAPTYPPGLPLVMSAAQILGGEAAVFLVVPLLGGIAVLCTYALGARLHSRTAGLVAAVLLASSPIFLFQIVQPMSDVAVTAWTALAVLIALLPFQSSAFAAGATTGLLLLTRPNLVPVALVVALVAIWPAVAAVESRGPWRPRFLAFAAGIFPALGALALLQWRLFGSPVASGYGSFGQLFGLANIAPNVLAYAGRIGKGETPALALAVISLVAVALSHTSAGTRRSAMPAVRIAALAAGAVLVCYLPYGVFTEWSYLRFLLPAFPFVFVAVGALVADASAALPVPARGVATVIALAITAALNVNAATREQAFNLRRYEARYRAAGRYLDATLPATAVVIAVQESASARHYAHVPILRWDLLRVDLDTAVATLHALGRTPVFLVEDWEMPDIQKHFPQSPLAHLDWQPRAEFGDETRVRLFDPADRGARSLQMDRVQ